MFVAGNYQLPSPAPGVEVFMNVSASYKGDAISNFKETETNYQKFESFTIWNASITWAKDNYSISIFGNNLSDELGQSIVSTADGWMGDRDQAKGVIRPRTIGIGFNYKVK